MKQSHGPKGRKASVNDQGMEHPGFRETDNPASRGGAFTDLHAQVGNLEQRAFDELEDALEAVSGKRQTATEPYEGTDGSTSAEKMLWRELCTFPDLFLMRIGTDGRPIFINDGMLKSLGYEAEEIAGSDIVRMLFPEPEQKMLESLFSSLSETDQPLSVETQMRSINQGTLSVRWQMKRVSSPDQSRESFLGIGMRVPQPERLFDVGSGLHEIWERNQAIEGKRSWDGDKIFAKKRLRKGFESSWAYVVIYLLASVSICVLGALSGSKAVYYNGWLVLLHLTRGLHHMLLPDRNFMFGQELFGDYALVVAGAILFLLPALFAIAVVKAVRAFGND